VSEIGIVPAPDGPYVELASQGARRFRKHILNVGETFVHPATGKPLTVTEDWWQRMKTNWDNQVCPIVQFPAANEKNQHTEDPRANLGQVTNLTREGRKVYVDIDVPDPAVADKIGKTILGASAMLHLNYRDSRSGERVGEVLCHVAATNRPHLVDLDPFEELAASDGQLWETFSDGSSMPPRLLMLCASEVDPDPPVVLAEPDYQPEPDYLRDYGGAMSQEDVWRDDIGRLGLEAMRLSSGRGSKPQYGMILTDRDRQAALSAAEFEVNDESILTLARELADEYHVRTDVVHALCHDAHQRSGLGRSDIERVRVLAEVGLALSQGQLEVSDEQVLGLSANGGSDYWAADAEIIRLTSEPDHEDMFGLAHPSKSGKSVTTRGKNARAHSDPDEDASAESPDASIERYRRMIEDTWGAEARHAGSHGSTSYPAKSPQQREREEERARAGHQGDMRSIPDYARGSARTRSGR